MRARLLMAFLLGAVLGAAALWLVTGPREVIFPHAVVGPKTVRVLVAKQELSYGQRLRPKHLQWVEWPERAVPPGAFTDVEALLGENGDQTRTVLRTIEPGEPILQSKISGIGESPRTAVELGEGRRAVSLPIGRVQGISGFVAPGDRVDIVLIREIEGEVVSNTIMRDVEVIAVVPPDRKVPEGVGEPGTVTVELSTIQAQKLALAQRVGKLSLTLRGVGDDRPDVLPPDVPSPDVPPPVRRERCERPWSKYHGFPRDVVIPNLCRTSTGEPVGPSLRRRSPLAEVGIDDQ